MRLAAQGASPELNPEGSPRRDAEAGGGWASLRQESWGPGHSGWQERQAQALGARPVPPLEAWEDVVRESCRKPQGVPRVCSGLSRCAAGPQPCCCCAGTAVCHTLVTGPARHVVVILRSPGTQASFLRL